MFVKFLHSLYVFIIISFSLIDWNVICNPNSFISCIKLLSCQGKTSSETHGGKQVSAPDTVLAYKYKESGKKKSANGDQQGAIDDYTKAIYFNPNS